MVRLRFNLGRGDNYKKWQLKTFREDSPALTEHFDPSEVAILLINPQLKNSKTTANKIFEGKNKTVCAWVLAEDSLVFKASDAPFTINKEKHPELKISYNPRKAPYWADNHGQDIDDDNFSYIVSNGTDLFNIDPRVLEEFRGGYIPEPQLLAWAMHDLRLVQGYEKLLTKS